MLGGTMCWCKKGWCILTKHGICQNHHLAHMHIFMLYFLNYGANKKKSCCISFPCIVFWTRFLPCTFRIIYHVCMIVLSFAINKEDMNLLLKLLNGFISFFLIFPIWSCFKFSCVHVYGVNSTFNYLFPLTNLPYWTHIITHIDFPYPYPTYTNKAKWCATILALNNVNELQFCIQKIGDIFPRGGTPMRLLFGWLGIKVTL